MKIYIIERFVKVFHADSKPTSNENDILRCKEIEVDENFTEGLLPSIELGLPQAYFHKKDDKQMMIYRYEKLYFFDLEYLQVIQERYPHLYKSFKIVNDIEYARHYISHGHNYFTPDMKENYKKIEREFPWMEEFGANFPFKKFTEEPLF